MRRCDGILNDSSALVSDGCDEWLTNGVAFVWVVGTVGLTVTEPGLGDAGFLVETVKLPYVTQDGLWDGMEEGSKKRERQRCSMRRWSWPGGLCVFAGCTSRHEWRGTTCCEWIRWRSRKCCFTFSALSADFIICFCLPLSFLKTGGHPPQKIRPKLRWHKNCQGVVILTAHLLKDRMSFALWKTITKAVSASLLLSFSPPRWCAFIWWWDWRSSVKAQPTKKSS